jgi:hypothetical protein
MDREAWALYDARTGRRLAMSSYLTAEQAAWEVDNLRKRDKEGKLRTEMHDLMPHIGFIKLTPDTWGSKPGDIIDGRGTA